MEEMGHASQGVGQRNPLRPYQYHSFDMCSIAYLLCFFFLFAGNSISSVEWGLQVVLEIVKDNTLHDALSCYTSHSK